MNLTSYATWTAVITPLNANFEVDYDSLASVVKAQDAAKNGLLILGSTAEALNLTLTDKKKIVEYVIGMKPTSPIMIGVGGHQLEETQEWLAWLETKNVNAYLMVTPLYAKPGPIGQYNWFKSLMDGVKRPCMLYNVPGRTAVAMSTEAVAKLSSHPNFWAIKEASGSVEKFKEYLKAANGKPVYCGDDALMPEFALAGSTGLVSVAANAWPKETNLYTKMCVSKTFDDKQLWTEASNSLFIVSNPVPVKTLMYKQGAIKTPNMVAPLCHEDLKDASPLIKADREVSAWYQRSTK